MTEARLEAGREGRSPGGEVAGKGGTPSVAERLAMLTPELAGEHFEPGEPDKDSWSGTAAGQHYSTEAPAPFRFQWQQAMNEAPARRESHQ